MQDSIIRLNRNDLQHAGDAAGYEWWLANGIGGYAAGTVSGVLTRRYHGLLIAPLEPPLGRSLLFAKADAVLIDADAETALHSNQWRGGVFAPSAHYTIEHFRLDRTMPVWRHVVGDLAIEQRIWMDHGRNQTRVAFRWTDGRRDRQPRIRLGLLASKRDHHAVNRPQGSPYRRELLSDGLRLHLPDGQFVDVHSDDGRFTTDETWIEHFHLAREHERGLEDTDHHLRIAHVEIPLRADRWVGVSISLDTLHAPSLDASLAAELARLDALPALRTDAPPAWIRQLNLAADAFLFARHETDATQNLSVIAGYPWFGDWGRDTMIALPGLTLASGRTAQARDILQTFAAQVSEGMLPNRFTGSGTEPEYNTVDAALWFIEAWRAYIDATHDIAALQVALPVLQQIVDAYCDGTRYGIGMDPADGLVRAGVAGQQLTWMDARADGIEVTPRHGKPVEINALWYNALRTMAGFARLLDVPADRYDALAERVAASFRRFHRGGNQGLYDVLDGPGGDDPAVRPNQVFALSLHHPVVQDAALRRYIIDEVEAELLTPFGLRSLSPGDPHYCGSYRGSVAQRDGAYHQGTVWGWLLGHYVLAEYSVRGDPVLARQRLSGMAQQLSLAGLGQLSEIFDGDLPYRPRGAPAQAWSVACTLEAWWRLDRQAADRPGDRDDDKAERSRLAAQRAGAEDWRLWGPYLSERAWGTVREDYSAHGTSWEYFSHDQARARAYRWSEDGLGGISDEGQRLCFALALWNGRDPILKERAFGLTGNEGNHGEDVKEYYFYRDATPSHSYLHYLYKYPQRAFPYHELVTENARRGRLDAPFNLLDSGALDERRYWDIDVRYAKAAPDEIHVHVDAHNRGADAADIDLIPTLWFRNTWSWDEDEDRPQIRRVDSPDADGWAVVAEHPELGSYHLYGRQSADLLFTENESNTQRLWQIDNASPYVKDAFDRRIVQGDEAAVNPDQRGSKFAAWSRWRVEPGQWVRIALVLSARPLDTPFAASETVFSSRRAEADAFYDDMLPEAGPQDMRILRQALAGMIWTKQFFHYDVERWIDGDRLPPPDARRFGRNRQWRHLKAHDIVSMPDKWEYPWFAAWDLAYHCAALALVDVDFAKDQVELMLSERYLHPNGQIPAYEWAFGDVNPPVHAMGALKVFRAERVQRGQGDLAYLQRVFNKLLLNFAWWINRKDAQGHNLFEGGFLGLDNISVYDRSRALPGGYSLKQADATGWMAMFALNMTAMALELCAEDAEYEDMAIQCYLQFLSIAEAISGGEGRDMPSLWDREAGFFKDLLVGPDGSTHYIDAFSWVGLIPLFATEVVDQRLLANAPRFRDLLRRNKGGLFRGRYVCTCPDWENERGEHLLALVDHSMLPRILRRLLDEEQFLSPYGIRGLSKVHATQTDLGHLPGIGHAHIEYVPGESSTGLFGGNSNWRGPVWMPTNYSLVQAIEKFHRFLGPGFTVEAPCLGNQRVNLQQVANLLADRMVALYRRDDRGRIPALRRDSPFQDDEAWQGLTFFYEYFHGETGQGLGAAHQTGWTGLLANLVMRRYQRDIKPWSALDQGRSRAWMDELA